MKRDLINGEIIIMAIDPIEAEVSKMIEKIKARNPNAVTFAINDNTIKSILKSLTSEDFFSILYLYGHPFLMEILRIYEKRQKFESCVKIRKTVEEHNRNTKDNLSTGWR